MLKIFEEQLKKNISFLILCSKPIDNDSLGSGIVLKKYLESLGKRCQLIFPRPMTSEEKERSNYLPYIKELQDMDTREIFNVKKYDCLIFLDGTNLVQYYDNDKSNDNPPKISIYPIRIRIDHHEQNAENIATINIHKKKSSSTMEVLLSKIIPLDFIDQKLATLSYAAIVGDTGNFQWNFFPSTLKLAAKLLFKGADVNLVIENVLFSKTKLYFEMLSYVIKNSEYRDDLGTCFVFLPYQKLSKDKITGEKLKELKQSFQDTFARRVIGYPRGIIVYEKIPGRIWISIRGNNLTNKINFPVVLKEIGGNGGGHFNAAGFDIEADFKTFKQSLISLLQKHLYTPGCKCGYTHG